MAMTIIDDSGPERIIEEEEDEKPRIGMLFDNLEVAWEFWKKYGKFVGFGVRKHYFHRSRKDNLINSVVYVCCREGRRQEDKRRVNSVHRWETRSQCQVKITLVLDRDNQKYKVKDFIEEHNHELEPRETRYMSRSQKKVSASYNLTTELASDAGLTSRATHELCKDVGGTTKFGFIIEDEKSYLRSRREKNMVYGELGNIIKYFEEQKMKDHGFFYSMQFDSAELITNIFWTDSRMIVDYINFGDVVIFDTTYDTSKDLRFFGVFVGFDHHRQKVILGAALMYDETEASFVWLFETFMKAHSGKSPQTIFIDDHAAITKALQGVWPDTRHGLCTWHLNQNGLKHLGWRMKEGSTFLKDFKKCMFEYSEETEFEKEWENLLERHNLRDNDWMLQMYRLKEKWAKCYMKYAFTLGLSTQLSESLDSDLRDYLKCDMNITHFFRELDRVIEQYREKELEAEFRSHQKAHIVQYLDSPLLEQASQRYTPQIFEIFETEFRRALRAMVQTKDESQTPHEYVVCFHDSKDKTFKVLCDPEKEFISCSCRMFDYMGILCCHALKIFMREDIMDISSKYILPRWTRGYKSARLLSSQDVKEDGNQWIKRVQSQLLSMTHQASTHDVTQQLLEKMIMECDSKIYEFVIQNAGVDKRDVDIGNAFKNLKGLKRKEGSQCTRVKPLHEVNCGKRKQTFSATTVSAMPSQSQPSIGIMSSQSSTYMQHSQPLTRLPVPWSAMGCDFRMPSQYLDYSEKIQGLNAINRPYVNVVCGTEMPLQDLNNPHP